MPNYVKKMIPTGIFVLLDMIIFFSIPSQVGVYEEGLMNARFVPYLVTILIFVCGLWDMVKTYRQGRREEDKPKVYFQKRGTMRVLAAVAILAVWLWVMPLLGFVPATFLLSAAVMLLAGNRSVWQILILSAVLSVLVYLLFKEGLNLRLPQGLFFF